MSYKVQCNDSKKTICILNCSRRIKNWILDSYGGNSSEAVGKELPIMIYEYNPDKFMLSVDESKAVITSNQEKIRQ